MAFPFAARGAGIAGQHLTSGSGHKPKAKRQRRRAWAPRQEPLRTRRKVLFEPLEPRLLLAADLGVLDDGGLNDYFDEVQNRLDSAVFSAPIPLIGTQLAERQSGRIAERISIALDSFTIVPANQFTPTVDDVIDVVTAIDRGQGYGPLSGRQHRRRIRNLSQLGEVERAAVWYAR